MKKLDIKTALSAAETRTLQLLARGKRVVEVGALLGFSTVTLAQVAELVVSIDPHSGYPYYNPSPTFPIFQHNVERFGLREKVIPRVGTAQEVLPTLKAKHEFAFVDCTGFYSDTKFCLDNVNTSVIAVHDFGRRGCEGVDRAVLEFVKRHGKRMTVVDTLVVIE